MKVVINRCFGGFGLSDEAHRELGSEFEESDFALAGGGYWTLTGDLAEFDNWSMDMKFRTHPRLVDVVERLGHRANGRFADLGIVEIPDDAINPRIDEYDGNESVTEGREWR